MHEQNKKGGAMPGAGRPKTDVGAQFRELELRGFNETLSIIGQNIVEFWGGEISKSNLYHKINRYQPEFSGAVKNILEK
jgi:hypothetical protein